MIQKNWKVAKKLCQISWKIICLKKKQIFRKDLKLFTLNRETQFLQHYWNNFVEGLKDFCSQYADYQKNLGLLKQIPSEVLSSGHEEGSLHNADETILVKLPKQVHSKFKKFTVQFFEKLFLRKLHRTRKKQIWQPQCRTFFAEKTGRVHPQSEKGKRKIKPAHKLFSLMFQFWASRRRFSQRRLIIFAKKPTSIHWKTGNDSKKLKGSKKLFSSKCSGGHVKINIYGSAKNFPSIIWKVSTQSHLILIFFSN